MADSCHSLARGCPAVMILTMGSWRLPVRFEASSATPRKARCSEHSVLTFPSTEAER